MLDTATALVTGASSGIGQATALSLARRGTRVVVSARRDDRLHALCSQIESLGVSARTLCLDVRDRASVQREIDALFASGWNVNVLINNAGLAAGLDTLDNGDPEHWDRMIDTNVKGLLNVSRAVLPYMKASGGHVVNIGSIAGREVYPKGNVYCATKFAVHALNKAMRLDLCGSGIRVTTVDPGLVETEFSLVRFDGDARMAKTPYEGMTPLAPEDVAEAVVWALDRPPHVNVEELLLMPTDQASAGLVHRRK